MFNKDCFLHSVEDCFGIAAPLDQEFFAVKFSTVPEESSLGKLKTVILSSPSLNQKKYGVFDFRGVLFLRNPSEFSFGLDTAISLLIKERVYLVLCNTPRESAFFYLLQMRAAVHGITLMLFSGSQAAFSFIGASLDWNEFDFDLQALAGSQVVANSCENRMAI